MDWYENWRVGTKTKSVSLVSVVLYYASSHLEEGYSLESNDPGSFDSEECFLPRMSYSGSIDRMHRAKWPSAEGIGKAWYKVWRWNSPRSGRACLEWDRPDL